MKLLTQEFKGTDAPKETEVKSDNTKETAVRPNYTVWKGQKIYHEEFDSNRADL